MSSFLEFVTQEGERPQSERCTIIDIFVDEAEEKNSTMLPLLIELQGVEKNLKDEIHKHDCMHEDDRVIINRDKLDDLMEYVYEIADKLSGHADFPMLDELYNSYRYLDTSGYPASARNLIFEWRRLFDAIFYRRYDDYYC
jgi:hypothetical protein